MWVFGAFYKQATPNGVTQQRPTNQICAAPPTEENFRPLTPATGGTYVFDDLPSMTRQWIRVRGVSKKSVGPWSQLANKVVP